MEIRQAAAHARSQGSQPFRNARAGDALAQMALHFEAAHKVQLPIDISMDQLLYLAADHARASLGLASSFCSRARARASRDITVPTGTAVTSAISLYDRPSISRRITISRNSAGNSSSARRTRSPRTAASRIASGLGLLESTYMSSSSSTPSSSMRLRRIQV